MIVRAYVAVLSQAVFTLLGHPLRGARWEMVRSSSSRVGLSQRAAEVARAVFAPGR